MQQEKSQVREWAWAQGPGWRCGPEGCLRHLGGNGGPVSKAVSQEKCCRKESRWQIK